MVKRNIVIDKKYRFQLEIYLGLDCHDDITWEIFPEDYQKNPDDTHRLFYVACTRTEDNLYIIEPQRKKADDI